MCVSVCVDIKFLEVMEQVEKGKKKTSEKRKEGMTGFTESLSV